MRFTVHVKIKVNDISSGQRLDFTCTCKDVVKFWKTGLHKCIFLQDHLLRRLGAELRKLKKGGGAGALLQELALMEQRMPSEEYNTREEESHQV